VCARILPVLLALTAVVASSATAQTKPKTMAEVLAASKPSDWRELDPQRTLYMELGSGRVIIELAPQFAPAHVANVIALVREGYFDGLAVMRSQDNYVAQWGDADGKRQIKTAKRTLPAEFERSSKDLPFTLLPDQDTYAAEVGFSEGFPAARDPALGRAWPVHCYGMVGAGRDEDVDSGGGTELYAVTGHSPRHLDRNVTLLGRVVKGMDLLSSLPRGTAELGFYEKPEQRVPIRSVRIAADVPEAERTRLSILRTDTQTFMDLVESRRNRRDTWFKVPAGRIEVCNVPIPVRQ
jgi:peptidylprolyl isomerase